MENPLLHIELDVPFDRITAAHVRPAIDALLGDARAAIDGISGATYDATLGALERATERLDWAMTVVGHLESVATTDELRAVYNEVQPLISELYTAIPLHDGLYRALRDFAATGEAQQLDPTRRRFLDKTLADFRRHGAELSATDKERLQALDLELTKLTTTFAQNVLDSTNAFELLITDENRLSGLPESARAAARQSAADKGVEGWRFTLQAPSLIPVLTYADDAALRETLYRASNSRAASGALDNRPLISRIVELRDQRARLLGFHDFADLVLEDRMAKTGGQARAFVDDLRTRTLPAFARENQQLEKFAGQKLQPWDVAYQAEKQRQALYDFDEEQLRPYFSVDRVLPGLFRIVETLYGIRIQERAASTWDPAVRTYGLLDGDGALIASFYVDLYPRENKRGGAWMNGLYSQAWGSGGRQVGLFCANVSPPLGGQPALLTHREVETLFHEFGHLMHHSLSRVGVRTLSGTNVAWDFVELPSQIMENWCWEREALDLFARHFEDGSAIPADLFEKMSRARKYRAANQQMRQLGFATVDLRLHTEHSDDVIALARDILSQHAAVPLPDDYAMICGFTHLFASPVGYAAGYYSYKWAEVLDADAFTRFAREGVVNPAVGRAFRENILQRGDSEDPGALFQRFMGRPPSLDALLARNGLSENQQ